MTTVNPPTCPQCNESLRGHTQPFTDKLRSCETARIFRNAPDPMFCRYPVECTKKKKCQSIEKYGRACDD